MKRDCYFVYIVASKSRVLYIGMTNALDRRVWEHQNDLFDGFSKQYRCHRLVYYESFDDVRTAIDREKQIKRWNRAKKVFLIEHINPTRGDLCAEWGKQIEPLKTAGPSARRMICCANHRFGRDDRVFEICNKNAQTN